MYDLILKYSLFFSRSKMTSPEKPDIVIEVEDELTIEQEIELLKDDEPETEPNPNPTGMNQSSLSEFAGTSNF